MMESWLIQVIIDLATGADIGFSFSQVVLLTIASILIEAFAYFLALLPLAVSICTGNLVAKAEKTVSDKNETYMSTLKDSLVGFSVITDCRAW